jgi:PAS domain S-box-containing protein
LTANEGSAFNTFVINGLEMAGIRNDPWFRKILDSTPAAIYLTDAKGMLTYFNPATVTLAGRTPMVGADRWWVTRGMMLPDGTHVPHDECPMAAVLNGKETTAGIEVIAERPDGSQRWVTQFPSAIRDEEGRILGGINLLIDVTDRKMAEREAREQFHAIVETAPECVMIVALDGTLLFMNGSGLEMLGASSADVLGRSVYGVIAAEDRDRFGAFSEGICGGKRGFLQFDMIGLKGVRCQMETHSAPLQHVDGTTVHLAVTHDVTNRRRAERGARLLASIVDSSEDAIISKDLEGIITSWNKSAERIFGYRADEIIGRSVTLLIPDDRPEEEPQILARLRRGERVDHFETLRRRKDGSLLEISLTISPVKDSRGRIVGASKIARDITDRKRAEVELKKSEERFRQLADLGPQIVWLSGPRGDLEFVNQRWVDFSGLDFEATRDPKQIENHLHPDDGVLKHWHEAVTAGRGFELEARLRGKDGEFRWFMMRSVPVRDVEGKILRWFGTSTDIHQNKILQLELRQTNQDLEQFAYSASHDLREPIRSIRIFSELLSARYGDRLEGRGTEFLEYVRGSASRIETLVGDLLAYTQTSRLEKPREPTNANPAVKAALENLAGAITEAGAVVECGVLPSVRVEATPLQQLFQNLIGNAVKYRRQGVPPVVRVEAQLQGSEGLFSVRDNGIGINSEYKERIFGLFKRLHTGDEYAGTGIGLALCQRIVERHNGRIWVESEPGEGSTFYFTLPL